MKKESDDLVEKEINLINNSKGTDLIIFGTLLTIYISIIIFIVERLSGVNFLIVLLALLGFSVFYLFVFLNPATRRFRAKHQMVRERYEKLGVKIVALDNELKKLS